MSNPTQSMPAILRFRLTKTRRVRGILVGSGVKVRPESGRASCSNDTVPHQPNPPGAAGRKPPGDPTPTPPQGGARTERLGGRARNGGLGGRARREGSEGGNGGRDREGGIGREG